MNILSGNHAQHPTLPLLQGNIHYIKFSLIANAVTFSKPHTLPIDLSQEVVL